MRAALIALAVPLCLPAADARPYFSEPSLSPDASEIAFVSGGDIWTVPARGGEARLLVSHPATESRPLFSPDGKRLAFVSTRTGNGDIYVLTFATGELKRTTFDDANDQLDAWSRDGKWLYFSSSAHDIAGMQDIYRVSAGGGTPMAVSADRYAAEYFSAPSPDGQTLAFTARGVAGTQWWRKGHSHLDESEIWLLREGGRYERFTEPGGAKECWPMWARNGTALWYVSDRGGAQNLWYRAMNGRAKQVTQFQDGRVLWPAISADGRAIVFERDFNIWKLDVESGKAAPVAIARRGSPAGPGVQHISGPEFHGLALSPDGKKVAFLMHGEVFAASAKDGGEAMRITHTDAPEAQVSWSPNSRRLVYVSTRDGDPHVFLYDFGTGKETQLTKSGADAVPRFSPDGKSIAFLRDGRELRALDVESKQERLLATGYFDRAPILSEQPYCWAPDSKWVAYFNVGGKGFSNVYLVTAGGSESKPVTFLANANANAVSWSPDGKFLLFATGQRTEPGQLARVDLMPRVPKFREDTFRDLFKEEPKGAAAGKDLLKVVPVILDGIRQRLSLLPLGLDVDAQTISPDGKTVVVLASAAGQQNLYTWPLDPLAREPVARQLTSTPGRKSNISFTPDSKEVFYIERGAINFISLETRQAKTLNVNAEMDVEFAREKMEVFRQGWGYIRDHFFDPQYHGVDWNGVRTQYEPLFAGAATYDEMRRLLNLMVGELNASHLGASGGTPSPATGRLGVRFDRAEYESSGKLKIVEVIPLSPAEVAAIKVGDVIEAVDGQAVDAHTNLDALLEYKIGKRVVLKLAAREAVVRPVNLATEKNLVYRQWVEQKRQYVAEKSGGKLGYAHMLDMSSGSLDRLHLDLDTENHARKGVIIDIRNNSGGFVNAYALDVLARRPYLRMTERGQPEAPARTVLGQRALEAPTVLVVNQHSLSDAEDFTEGYRTLKLGKVVGEPTAGWIIYTWGTTLLDGTGFRLPRTRIRGAAGDDMEMHPRQPDIRVTRPIGETGRDSQLDAAIAELLKEVER